MDDREEIKQRYEKMCSAMIKKDREALENVLDDSYVLVHMTGMRQSKSEFINAVMDGTLNYYSAVHESESVDITGDTAVVVGRSYVQAAVFGGGKHYWHLQQTCSLKKTNGNWRITRSVASTY